MSSSAFCGKKHQADLEHLLSPIDQLDYQQGKSPSTSTDDAPIRTQQDTNPK